MCLHHMFLSYSISVVVCALTSECGLISGTAEATGRGGGVVWDVVGESCLDRQAAPSYREALKGQDWFWDWEQLLGRGKCVCARACVRAFISQLLIRETSSARSPLFITHLPSGGIK